MRADCYVRGVNFFGHATVATWSDAPAATYVIGAMLPDFASISGARSLTASEPEVARGITLHHHTDEVFHAAPSFVALMIDARERFAHAGLPNGAARAASHIGVELLLDGTLVADAQVGRAYVDAIDALRAEHLVFTSADHAERFWEFFGRARGYGVPHAYVDPQFVAERIAGALANRPRLALGDSPVSDVARVLRVMQPIVVARAAALLDEVRSGLAAYTDVALATK